MSSWPSWPMFTSPALVAMIVPTATISSGAAVVSVSPHAPGERRLPSSRAENTLRHEPPVAATSSAHSASADGDRDHVERRRSTSDVADRPARRAAR